MSARILVVDDVEVNVRLLEAKLSSEYFTVITASGGAEALRLARGEHPDIILLDVMMPEMDGFEVCKRLKADATTADIPVVMVTALSEVSDRVHGLQSGADDFLTKPVNDVALFARVRSLVRLKRMMEEWRLREEVYGRFDNVIAEARRAEDVSPARVVIWEEMAFAADRLAEMLQGVAQSVQRATSPDDLREKVDGTTDLVILSLAGEQDALRLVAQLRGHEASRLVPILLVADGEDLQRLAKGLDLGANDYIVRPLDRNEITARARTQIRRKRLQDQSAGQLPAQSRAGAHRQPDRPLQPPLSDGPSRRLDGARRRGRLGAGDADGRHRLLQARQRQPWPRLGRRRAPRGGEPHRPPRAQLRPGRTLRRRGVRRRSAGNAAAVAAMVAERLRTVVAAKPIALSDRAGRDQRHHQHRHRRDARGRDTAASMLQRADKALYEAQGGAAATASRPSRDPPGRPGLLSARPGQRKGRSCRAAFMSRTIRDPAT